MKSSRKSKATITLHEVMPTIVVAQRLCIFLAKFGLYKFPEHHLHGLRQYSERFPKHFRPPALPETEEEWDDGWDGT